MSSHQISTKRTKLEKSSSFVNPLEYVHFVRLDIFYIMFIGNIVNSVQHGHLYNSFLLIIVACIVILLVAILYISCWLLRHRYIFINPQAEMASPPQLGHRVKFLGEGIRHALPLFTLDHSLYTIIYSRHGVIVICNCNQL